MPIALKIAIFVVCAGLIVGTVAWPLIRSSKRRSARLANPSVAKKTSVAAQSAPEPVVHGWEIKVDHASDAEFAGAKPAMSVVTALSGDGDTGTDAPRIPGKTGSAAVAAKHEVVEAPLSVTSLAGDTAPVADSKVIVLADAPAPVAAGRVSSLYDDGTEDAAAPVVKSIEPATPVVATTSPVAEIAAATTVAEVATVPTTLESLVGDRVTPDLTKAEIRRFKVEWPTIGAARARSAAGARDHEEHPENWLVATHIAETLGPVDESKSFDDYLESRDDVIRIHLRLDDEEFRRITSAGSELEFRTLIEEKSRQTASA